MGDTMLSLSGQWLFVHVPKTGGNSLQSTLVSLSDDKLVGDELRDGVERFEVTGPVTRHKHFSMQDYFDALGPGTFTRLFKFGVVRDPWERAISWYFSPHRWTSQCRPPVWSPEEFRSSLCQMPRAVDMLSIEPQIMAADMVLRFEKLHQDAQDLFSRLGVGPLALPLRNFGLRNSDWRTYYLMYPDLVDLVSDLFGTDAENFGYNPPLCQRARSHGRGPGTARRLCRCPTPVQ
jgi:hypothetical protein